jgi:hypothetical protein
MYIGEMESMKQSFASILGMHPSTIVCLTNTASNFQK